MFKKLRWKFIALNMGTVLAVLIASFSAICYLDYTRDVQYVYEQLTLSVQSAHEASMMIATVIDNKNSNDAQQNSAQQNNQDDAFSGVETNKNENPSDSTSNTAPESTPSSTFEDTSESGTSSSPAPPTIGKRNPEATIPTAVYFVTESGIMTLNPTVSTATMDDDARVEIGQLIAQNARTQTPGTTTTGHLDNYDVYYAQITGEQGSFVAFADASYAAGWKDLALVLVLVGLGALIIFFIISLFFSKWALRPIQESWQQQKRFIADASHDLKTPLTVIAANQSILLEQTDATIGSMSKWIESTQAETQNMQDLIADMLLLAKHDEQGSQGAQEAIMLSTLVEGMVLEFESVAFERNITLEAQVAPCVYIAGDPSKIRRLISTLLDNGCKYAHSRIHICLRTESTQVILEVENDGTPISKEEQELIFERFYRGDASRSNPSSHGLGLAIARAIAQDHQGTLIAQGTETGTMFKVTLPLTKTNVC